MVGHRRLFLCGPVVVIAFGLGAKAQAVGGFHRVLAVSGAVSLDVSSASGTVEVDGAVGSSITIDGTLHSSFLGDDADEVKQIEANPPIAQDGGRIVVSNPGRGWGNHVSISYVISAPPGTVLKVHTASGNINVVGIDGGVDLGSASGTVHLAATAGSARVESVSGSIHFERIGGDAHLSDTSGTIEGNEVDGTLTASTVSGGIRIARAARGAEAHSVSGSIDLENVSGDLAAHNTSGHITAGGELTGSHRWDVGSVSGTIRLSLPASVEAQAHLSSTSGGITLRVPTSGSISMSRRSWQGTLGGNPRAVAELRASSVSGGIRVD